MITLSFPGFARVGVREAPRLDQFHHLAPIAVGARRDDVRREQAGAHELLRDGRAAAVAGPGHVLGDRGQDRGGVEPAVRPERSVLGSRRGVENEPRDFVERHDASLLLLEDAELDLAAAIPHGRRFREGQVFEGRRIRQLIGDPIDGDKRSRADGPDTQRRQRHHRQGDDRHEDEDSPELSARRRLHLR